MHMRAQKSVPTHIKRCVECFIFLTVILFILVFITFGIICAIGSGAILYTYIVINTC